MAVARALPMEATDLSSRELLFSCGDRPLFVGSHCASSWRRPPVDSGLDRVPGCIGPPLIFGISDDEYRRIPAFVVVGAVELPCVAARQCSPGGVSAVGTGWSLLGLVPGG
jgi:hypothetical protein